MLTPSLAAALVFLQAGPQPQMVVRTPPKPQTAGSDACIRMELARVMPVIPISIGGRELKVGLDTGAPGGPHLPMALIEALGAELIGEAHMSDPSLQNPELTLELTAIPEPSTSALLGAGLAVLLCFRRRIAEIAFAR